MSFDEQLFQHPFSCIIAGPSKAGKTVFASRFLKHVDSLCSVPPAEILWCYSEYQPHYKELICFPKVRLHLGVPSTTELKRDISQPKLVIFDDLMNEFKKDDTLNRLFSKGVHHWNISCIHIMQNLFFPGSRTARVNSHYLILFKNPSDKLQVSTLARQIYPQNTRHFMESFNDATEKPFTYLLVDLTQGCPEEIRLRTNIFPGEVMLVYPQ